MSLEDKELIKIAGSLKIISIVLMRFVLVYILAAIAIALFLYLLDKFLGMDLKISSIVPAMVAAGDTGQTFVKKMQRLPSPKETDFISLLMIAIISIGSYLVFKLLFPNGINDGVQGNLIGLFALALVVFNYFIMRFFFKFSAKRTYKNI